MPARQTKKPGTPRVKKEAADNLPDSEPLTSSGPETLLNPTEGALAAVSTLENRSIPSAPTTAPVSAGMIPLQIHLSREAHDKLAHHTRSGTWTPDVVIEELIWEGLHTAFLAINYCGVEIAERGLYRAFDRRALKPALLLRSTLGAYRVTPRPSNELYRHWLEVYEKRGVAGVKDRAAQMCVFLLVQDLEQVKEEGAKHIIYPEDFLVEKFV